MRTQLLCIHKRISCVYTRDLFCMHNTPVHALGQGTQGPWPNKGAWAGPRPGPRHFWALAPGFPGPEHAQECCACTRDLLCIHKRFFGVYTRNFLCMNHHDQGHDQGNDQGGSGPWTWPAPDHDHDLDHDLDHDVEPSRGP